jgi:hypothetical protein
MKQRETLQAVHDLFTAIVLNEVPQVKFTDADRMQIRTTLDVLCWALQHDHNKAFALNIARVLQRLHAARQFMSVDDAVDRQRADALLATGERFLIVRIAGQAETYSGIQCLTCLATSWNPNDLKNLYCGRCHVFHLDTLSVDLHQLETECARNTEPLQ